MKPKQYLDKYKIIHSPVFDRKEFLIDILADFEQILLDLKGNRSAVSYGLFQVGVKSIRQKWNSIFRQSCIQLEDHEKLWKYFYAAFVIKMRNELFPHKASEEELDKMMKDADVPTILQQTFKKRRQK